MRATVDRPRRDADRDRLPDRSSAIRGSCRRSSARGSCSRATTSSTTTCWSGSRRPTSCTSPISTPTTTTSRGCRQHLRRDIPILLPGYPTREQQRTLAQLGFTEFIRTVDGEELEIAPGLTVAIHTEVSITDGPGGDSAMVVSDGISAARQPERLPHHRSRRAARPRPGRPALAAVLRCDLVPDGVRHARRPQKRAMCEAKVESQFTTGDALRRGDRRPRRGAQRRPAGVPRRRPLAPQRDPRRRAVDLPRSTCVPRPARRPPGGTGILAIPGTTIEIAADGFAVVAPDRRTPRSARSSTTRSRTCAATRTTGSSGCTTSRPAGTRPPPTCSPHSRTGGNRCCGWRRRCARRSAPTACSGPASSSW